MPLCLDCQREIDRPHVRGPAPTLCLACKRQRTRDATNAWHRANPEKVLRHKKRKPPTTVLVCIDCGVEFPRPGRFGPLKTWCPSCEPAARRRRHQRNSRRGNLARYGLTPEMFAQMLEAQDDRCAICHRQTWGPFGPNVDHCHASGRARGLLCMACNQAIGQLRDDPAVIRRAAQYVEQGGFRKDSSPSD